MRCVRFGNTWGRGVRTKLCGSLVVSTQLPPQSVRPDAQVNAPHVPLEHVGTTPGQVVPQAPQWLGSVARLAQLPLQLVNGGWHAAAVQAPALHTCPAAHFTLHAPHVAGLVRSASHPSDTMPLQSAQPGQQVSLQAPPAQIWFALARNGQAFEPAVHGPHPQAGSSSGVQR